MNQREFIKILLTGGFMRYERKNERYDSDTENRLSVDLL